VRDGRAPGSAGRRDQAPALVGVVAATVLAAALVLYDLGSRSLWLDEGATFTTASQHGDRLWQAALNDGGNMFSYYLGMHYWMALFGSSEFSMRLPGALAAIVTVPTCAYLLTRLFDARAGVFGAFFVAVSVPFVWYAQDARAYVVALFLVSAATLAFVVAAQTGRDLAWAAYAALTVLAAYTLLLSAIVVLAQLASLLFRRPRGFRWPPLLASYGAMAVLVVPLAWVVADHGGQSTRWLPPPGPIFGEVDRYLLDFFASARSNGVPYNNSVVHPLVLVMVLCWAAGTWLFLYPLARHRGTAQTWGYGLLFCWFVIPPVLTWAISVTIQPVLSDRYVLAALLPASMIAGVALSRLRPWPIAAGAAVVVLVLRALVLIPSYGVPIENWRQGVMEVAARSEPHDCIAFFVVDAYTAFDYYVLHLKSLGGPIPVPVLPSTPWQSRAPYALDPASIPRSRMAKVVASCPRLWLVTSHALAHPPGPGVLAYRVQVYHTHEVLNAELSSSYRETSAWSFLGANVSLYIRRGS
jgi:4-amino-4-deoxy-L-arabinose transferase-like glycosyltransferase